MLVRSGDTNIFIDVNEPRNPITLNREMGVLYDLILPVTTHQIHPEARADALADRRTWLLILCITLASWIVLASSAYDDLARDGHTPGIEPWVREFASHLATLVCFAIVPVMLNRWPVNGQNWYRTVPVHIAATIVYSVGHTLFMVGVRKLLYPVLFDHTYTFGLSDPSIWLYEYRKDAYAYLIALLAFMTSRTLEQRRLEAEIAREDARTAGRLTLRSGGRIIFIDASDVIYAQAASNYVEVTTPHKTHLVRLTLASLEKLLQDAGTDHIRVHRSYIVNKHHIQEITPTGEGNVDITLDTGVHVPGSRSYRAQLPS